jgi:ketosteroid isomerase-like protein
MAHHDKGVLIMATQQALDEAEIRKLIDKLVESIRSADLEGLKTCFAADIVSFDVGPRLQDVGSQAKLSNWEEAFALLQPPLGYEIRDLSITASEDVAFAHGINRLSGILNGNRFGAWVRWTAGFRKVHGNWLIAHDQVSVPFDHVSGTALLNLEPDGLAV